MLQRWPTTWNTSCFTTWRQNKKTNAYGKVIPAARVSASEHPSRVFFFDDNLELDGLDSSSGICSLRDVESGEFVDFAAGMNGFELGHAGRHTAVLHSSVYNSVLVKANILDAIEDPDYFTRIIRAHSAPGEKIVVFMDVNSTIICMIPCRVRTFRHLSSAQCSSSWSSAPRRPSTLGGDAALQCAFRRSSRSKSL